MSITNNRSAAVSRILERFRPGERKVLETLTAPAKIQLFLDREVGYNLEPNGPTCYSPRMVLRKRVAHCMEGALLGALALRLLGYRPLLVDLEAVRDSDHVLAVYRKNGCWGAVAKSDYSGLRSREPIYRTLRELVMSYFDDYWNLRGERTMRRYSRPVNLARFDRTHPDWMTTEGDIWFIAEHLCDIPHTPLFPPAVARRLTRIDRRSFAAGLLGRSEPPARALRWRKQ